MKSAHLATRLRTGFVLVALAGTLAACGQNQESADQQSAVQPAVTDRGLAYVSNQESGVSVIDLNTMETVRTIDTKAGTPRGIGITADGKTLITANKEQGNISIIDTATGEVENFVDIGKNPEFVRIDGDLAFVSFEPSSEGGPPPQPGEVVEHDDDDDDDDEPARIAIVNIKDGKKLQEIVGGMETEGIEFSPDRSKLIITNEKDNSITVHDIASGDLVKTVSTEDIGQRPRGIKVSPDGSIYVATLEFGNSFMVMDKDFNVIRTVETGEGPYGVAFDRAGDRIYVAASKSKTLEVYDAKSYDKLKEVTTGDRCWHFTFTPDDKQILMACGRSNEVLVIDADNLEVSKRITDKELPWGVITYPKSAGSLDAPV